VSLIQNFETKKIKSKWITSLTLFFSPSVSLTQNTIIFQHNLFSLISLFLTHTFGYFLIFAFLRVVISLFLTHTFRYLLIFVFLRVFISLFLTNTFKSLLIFAFFLSTVYFDLNFVFVCFCWDEWNGEKMGKRKDSEA